MGRDGEGLLKPNNMTFAEEIRLGIPDFLPEPMPYDPNINHAPKRKEILNHEEKQLSLRNALRYFPKTLHAQLASEFIAELNTYGRIYMYRYRPTYDMYARPIDEYPHRSEQAAAIMLMIQNNLNPEVAQHPHELIVYGGNGAIFQNWAQYRLTMKYLSEMTDEQTLVMYSGHPLGGDERNGDTQLLEARRLGAHERSRREPVRTDDCRIVHVHRSAGHRARHYHHRTERGTQAAQREGRTAGHTRYAVRVVGFGWHVGGSA